MLIFALIAALCHIEDVCNVVIRTFTVIVGESGGSVLDTVGVDIVILHKLTECAPGLWILHFFPNLPHHIVPLRIFVFER